MKKLRIFLLVLFTITIFVTPVSAQEDVLQAQVGPMRDATGSARGGQVLENLKARAKQMIDKRVSDLQKLLTRIDQNKQLSEEAKSSLKNEITTKISSLTQAKTTIDGATDAESVQAVFKQVLAMKVYAYFMQKVHYWVALERLNNRIVQIETLITRLEAYLSKAESEGKDVTQLQTDLALLKTQLNTLKETLATIKTTLTSATETNYREVFASVRQSLNKARVDFATVLATLARLRGQFQTSNPRLSVSPVVSSTVTPSASPTTTLTPDETVTP